MKVKLSPKAEKYLKRLNNPAKERIIKALVKLSKEPPEGDIKALTGRGGFRLRAGGYRIIFDHNREIIIVLEIAPRGQVYK